MGKVKELLLDDIVAGKCTKEEEEQYFAQLFEEADKHQEEKLSNLAKTNFKLGLLYGSILGFTLALMLRL